MRYTATGRSAARLALGASGGAIAAALLVATPAFAQETAVTFQERKFLAKHGIEQAEQAGRQRVDRGPCIPQLIRQRACRHQA